MNYISIQICYEGHTRHSKSGQGSSIQRILRQGLRLCRSQREDTLGRWVALVSINLFHLFSKSAQGVWHSAGTVLSLVTEQWTQSKSPAPAKPSLSALRASAGEGGPHTPTYLSNRLGSFDALIHGQGLSDSSGNQSVASTLSFTQCEG